MNKNSPGNPDIGIRMLRIARRLLRGHPVSTAWVVAEFGVSVHTAKRDVDLVGMYLPVVIRRESRRGRPKAIHLVPRARA